MADKLEVPEGNDKTKAIYDNLPQEHKEKQSYQEWLKEMYHTQYDNWMPWIEDQYLKWFGKDNKASYATKDTLDKTKLDSVPQVGKIQGDVNSLVAGQFGKDGLAQPIGDFVSKEGVNRAERGGKDDKGNYVDGPAGTVANPVAQGASSAGGYLSSAGQGVKSAGGYVGGLVGGNKGEEEKK